MSIKRFVGIVKACAALDGVLIISWLCCLAFNPVLASHIAFVVIATVTALIVGGLLASPILLPLGVLGAALWTGQSLVSFLSNHVPSAIGNFKQKLFGVAS